MVQKLGPTSTGKTIVGLTGGFGTGKSTVAHFFEELGACVIDADKIAHEALMAGSPLYEKIAELFPEVELNHERGFDLKKMAEIVFSDSEKKKKLEAIVHPYVFDRIMEEIVEAEEKIVVVDVPLLYESGYNRFCDPIIVVKADEAVTTQRLKEKGFSLEEIKARRKAQWPLEEKIKKADWVIDNSGKFHQTRREVESLWKKLHTVSKGAL